MAGITNKLFIGVLLNPELKLLLNQSLQWKEEQTSIASKEKFLQEVHYQKKEYVGTFLTQAPSILDLQGTENKILQTIKQYNEDIDTQKLQSKIFPQVFLS